MRFFAFWEKTAIVLARVKIAALRGVEMPRVKMMDFLRN